MYMIKHLICKLKYFYSYSSSERNVNCIRTIGCNFMGSFCSRSMLIDVSGPSLITIGSNCYRIHNLHSRLDDESIYSEW